MVSVCPGGQVLLTCETNSSVFHWIVSSPHLDRPREIIVTSQGLLVSSEFRIDFTEFNVSLISRSPLISQLLINNVTNGSRVYCSEDGNENNSPMSIIIIIEGMIIVQLFIVMNRRGSEFKSQLGPEFCFSSLHFSIVCLQHLPNQFTIVAVL